ncbi:MAG: hypothetical protein AAGB00_05350 [Planctomycetota bacterium]
MSALIGFTEQLRMEWRQQARRPVVWFCLLAYFALAVGDTLQSGWSATGNLWVNGADMIARRSLIYSLLGTLAVAAIVAEPICRDRASSADGLVLSTGAGRFVLGLGRFVVAFAIVLLTASMFIPGMLLGALAPGIAAEQVGPLVAGHYAAAWLYYVLPNFALTSTLVFAVASRWQSQTAAYTAAVGLLTAWVVSRMLLGQDVLRHDVFSKYAILDPYASIASAEFTQGWTNLEKNTTFPPLAGLMLINRVLWGGLSLLLIGFGVWSYPSLVAPPTGKRPSAKPGLRGQAGAPSNAEVGALVRRGASFSAQLARVASWEIAAAWRRPGAKLTLGFTALSLWWSARSAVTHQFSLPTTDLLVHNTGFYFDKVLVLVVVWLAGDLMWRERTHGVGELIDALPTSDTARYLAKTLTLYAVVAAFWGVSIAVGLLYQFASGYYDFELGLFLTDSFVFKAPYYFWLATLAIAAQAILRRRYIAIGCVLMVYASGTLLDACGWRHPIYVFGRVSFFWYSLMDGYGHFWAAHLWRLAYWTLAASLIWLLGLWCSARGLHPLPRWTLLRGRLAQPRSRVALAALSTLLVLVGANLWVQSTVLAAWPPLDGDRQKALIERRYAEAWRDRPQPRIVAINGELDLYPAERRFRFVGEQTLENQSDDAIAELLVLAEPGLRVERLAPGSDAALLSRDHALNARVYRLAEPLLPGRRITMGFTTSWAPPPGFSVHAKNDNVKEVQPIEVVGNGTSLLNLQLMPGVGYTDRVEHKPTWKRRRYGLASEWRPPPLEVGRVQPHSTSHVGWVEGIDLTIRTDADQTAWHAGRLVREWQEPDGRRGYRFLLERPTRGWSEVLTGRYTQQRRQRSGVPDVVVAFDPRHDHVVEEFARAIQDAMAHFTSRYGPPPFDEFPLVEQSLHYDGMGARSGLGFASEILGWKSDLEASGGEDLAEIAAHMMGMSWFNDQVIPANTGGAKIIHAGLPYWSAQLYLHQRRGADVDRRLRLQAMMELFRNRSTMTDKESAFIDEMKDSTILKRKGSVLLLYLASLVGAEPVEAAFADFLREWRYQPAPYPTAEDFLTILAGRLPEDLRVLTDDIFRRVTTWRLKTVSATCQPATGGRWRLAAVVDVQKRYTTGWGEQVTAEPETPIWLGAFRGEGFAAGDLLRQELKTLPAGRSEVSWLLDEEPTRFGIDPYLLLPDRNPHDNLTRVSIGAGAVE